MMFRTARHIACAISGGVDSAVSALLLKRKGYHVTGVFMKNWDVRDETGKCTSDQDLEDAHYVCKHLEIPLLEVNFVKEYWTEVFNPMVEAYERGHTPNPDVMCNKYIKFDALFDYCIETVGADAVATGHYARTDVGEDLPPAESENRVKLLRAIDQVKDQTLFLCQIQQAALRRTLFPIGDITKDVVKQMAVSAGLEKIAQRKESTGVCFIGKRNFQSFIDQYVDKKPGNFIDIDTDTVVGQHQGIHQWTVGQRANIAGKSKAYFIAKVNMQNQDIHVAQGTNHPALFSETLFTEAPHWICTLPRQLYQEQMYDCKFRFQHIHPLADCTLTLSGGNGLIVSLARPLRALTAGQFAVFYNGDECLGSAKILRPGPSLWALNYRDRIKMSKDFR